MNKNKIPAVLIIAVSALLFIAGCKAKQEAGKEESGIIEISEKMFISQINDVYLNPRDYFEKLIKLEGIFYVEEINESKKTYYYVLRYGPGCCGNDGNVGFEVRWNNDQPQPYPQHNAWVEATGSVKIAKEGNYQFLYLDLSSLQELSKRGAETVVQ